MAGRIGLQTHSRVMLPTLMLVGSLGLAWVIYQELKASPTSQAVEQTDVATASLPALPEATPFIMPPAETFAAIVERPLFSPTRRPPTGEAAPAIVSVRQPLALKLTGVIASGTDSIAIFQPDTPVATSRQARRRTRRTRRPQRSGTSAPAMTSIRLKEGDNHQGWTLVEIEPAATLFRRGEQEARIELSFDAPAPVQARRSPTRLDEARRAREEKAEAAADQKAAQREAEQDQEQGQKQQSE